MHSEKTFYLASDILAEYALLHHSEEQDLINIIHTLFPKDRFIIAHIYIFQGRYTAKVSDIFLSNLKEIYPVSDIYSESSIPTQIQIHAIYKENLNTCTYLKSEKKTIGLYLESNHNRILFMDGIQKESLSFQDSMQYAYEEIFKTIYAYSFTPQEILKFWNYVPHIITEYGNFNKIRNEYFTLNNITSIYPAGTGIDCRLRKDIKSHTNCQLLSSTDQETQIFPLKTKAQCEAEYYGPKFSRAMQIKHNHGGVLFVSGTAAVGPNGETLFPTDIISNIDFTMNTVGSLLYEASMNFNDIKSSFVYLKKIEYLSNFVDLYEKNKWNFPYIYTVCDVCRDDWLFEFECIAAHLI